MNYKIDKFVGTLYIILTFVGLITLLYYSQANSLNSLLKQGFFFAPLSWVVVYAFVKKGNVDFFRKHENAHYIISILLLIAVLIFGKEILGAKRSINLIFFNFQPSYYTRIILISSLAIYISKYHELLVQNKLKIFTKRSAKFIIFYVVSVFLILKEPHLSVLAITSASLFLMLFLADLDKKVIMITFLAGALLVTGIFMFGKSYRFERLRVYGKYALINPNRKNIEVTADAERQIIESLGALSAGGLLGTKSDFGSAARNFVPEADTDYIFSFIGEEYGFIPSSLIVIIFFALFFRLFLLSRKIQDLYKRYLAIGLSLNFIFTVIVNIGVAISTLPSTGVSLPFISYGGSAFLMDSFSLSIVLNIIAREGVAK
jgi:cell division protein FtsW (lipid II flippase)